MKKITLMLLLASSYVFGLNFGLFKLEPEIGGVVSYNLSKLSEVADDQSLNAKNTDNLSYGAYARVWLGVAGVMLAPQVKYDYLKTGFEFEGEKSPKYTLHNIQYGGVLGYEIPLIKLTPFVGASYSTFKGNIEGDKLKDTFAINFGCRWSIPLVPLLTLGFEGSWQRAEVQNPVLSKIEMLNLGGTLGLTF